MNTRRLYNTPVFNMAMTTDNLNNNHNHRNIQKSNHISNSNDNVNNSEVCIDYDNEKLLKSDSSASNLSIANSDDTNPSSSGGRDEWINVMVEDLVEWLHNLYPELYSGINAENFFDRLSDGVLLCHHANELHSRLTLKMQNRPHRSEMRLSGKQIIIPSQNPVYQTRRGSFNNAAISFVSRNNVSNFIEWCRQLGMCDAVLFESEDLVCRKNLRNVVVCLLELARLGKLVGLEVPELVKLEEEIDQELILNSYTNNDYFELNSRHSNHSYFSTNNEEVDADEDEDDIDKADNDYEDGVDEDNNISSINEHLNCKNLNSSFKLDTKSKAENQNKQRNINKNFNNKNKKLNQTKLKTLTERNKLKTNQEEKVKQKPEIQRPKVDLRSLDELVRELISQCTCKQTFPMIRVGEGRYLFGDKNTQIFVRILRNHVMVRVGGGWDTLSHFLAKYDECRKNVPLQINQTVLNSVKQSTNGSCRTNEDKSQMKTNLMELKKKTEPNQTTMTMMTSLNQVKKNDNNNNNNNSFNCLNNHPINNNQDLIKSNDDTINSGYTSENNNNNQDFNKSKLQNKKHLPKYNVQQQQQPQQQQQRQRQKVMSTKAVKPPPSPTTAVTTANSPSIPQTIPNKKYFEIKQVTKSTKNNGPVIVEMGPIDLSTENGILPNSELLSIYSPSFLQNHTDLKQEDLLNTMISMPTSKLSMIHECDESIALTNTSCITCDNKTISKTLYKGTGFGSSSSDSYESTDDELSSKTDEANQLEAARLGLDNKVDKSLTFTINNNKNKNKNINEKVINDNRNTELKNVKLPTANSPTHIGTINNNCMNRTGQSTVIMINANERLDNNNNSSSESISDSTSLELPTTHIDNNANLTDIVLDSKKSDSFSHIQLSPTSSTQHDNIMTTEYNTTIHDLEYPQSVVLTKASDASNNNLTDKSESPKSIVSDKCQQNLLTNFDVINKQNTINSDLKFDDISSDSSTDHIRIVKQSANDSQTIHISSELNNLATENQINDNTNLKLFGDGTKSIHVTPNNKELKPSILIEKDLIIASKPCSPIQVDGVTNSAEMLVDNNKQGLTRSNSTGKIMRDKKTVTFADINDENSYTNSDSTQLTNEITDDKEGLPSNVVKTTLIDTIPSPIHSNHPSLSKLNNINNTVTKPVHIKTDIEKFIPVSVAKSPRSSLKAVSASDQNQNTVSPATSANHVMDGTRCVRIVYNNKRRSSMTRVMDTERQRNTFSPLFQNKISTRSISHDDVNKSFTDISIPRRSSVTLSNDVPFSSSTIRITSDGRQNHPPSSPISRKKNQNIVTVKDQKILNKHSLTDEVNCNEKYARIGIKTNKESNLYDSVKYNEKVKNNVLPTNLSMHKRSSITSSNDVLAGTGTIRITTDSRQTPLPSSPINRKKSQNIFISNKQSSTGQVDANENPALNIIKTSRKTKTFDSVDNAESDNNEDSPPHLMRRNRPSSSNIITSTNLGKERNASCRYQAYPSNVIHLSSLSPSVTITKSQISNAIKNNVSSSMLSDKENNNCELSYHDDNDDDNDDDGDYQDDQPRSSLKREAAIRKLSNKEMKNRDFQENSIRRRIVSAPCESPPDRSCTRSSENRKVDETNSTHANNNLPGDKRRYYTVRSRSSIDDSCSRKGNEKGGTRNRISIWRAKTKNGNLDNYKQVDNHTSINDEPQFKIYQSRSANARTMEKLFDPGINNFNGCSSYSIVRDYNRPHSRHTSAPNVITKSRRSHGEYSRSVSPAFKGNPLKLNRPMTPDWTFDDTAHTNMIERKWMNQNMSKKHIESSQPVIHHPQSPVRILYETGYENSVKSNGFNADYGSGKSAKSSPYQTMTYKDQYKMEQLNRSSQCSPMLMFNQFSSPASANIKYGGRSSPLYDTEQYDRAIVIESDLGDEKCFRTKPHSSVKYKSNKNRLFGRSVSAEPPNRLLTRSNSEEYLQYFNNETENKKSFKSNKSMPVPHESIQKVQHSKKQIKRPSTPVYENGVNEIVMSKQNNSIKELSSTKPQTRSFNSFGVQRLMRKRNASNNSRQCKESQNQTIRNLADSAYLSKSLNSVNSPEIRYSPISSSNQHLFDYTDNTVDIYDYEDNCNHHDEDDYPITRKRNMSKKVHYLPRSTSNDRIQPTTHIRTEKSSDISLNQTNHGFTLNSTQSRIPVRSTYLHNRMVHTRR